MAFVFDEYMDFIPDYPLFDEAVNRPSPVHVRVNGLKTRPDSVMESLRLRGIKAVPVSDRFPSFFTLEGVPRPGNLPEYHLGHVHPQALTSCLASLVLAPSPGSRVLDMCAAPGGKTAHISELMRNRGLVVANELVPARQSPLGHTLSRLGVMNAVVTGYQAQEFPLRNRFDFILADVPCSGEGGFRAEKQHKKPVSRPGRVNLPELQRRIIIRGFDMLAEGGVMVYSTCTYNPDENEAVVQHLLELRNADLLPIQTGFNQEPGLLSWKTEDYDPKLSAAVRFYPHRVDSVGFFMARICRRS
jgi:NOL1/NOP2/sun family putative RNA methylase